MSFERKYMERAIELAKKGIGAVNPNPLVGAVIVKDNRIIGEGYHARYGELHAERAALASLNEPAEGAEMYVTLEPCCHYGKQPPCVEAIVEHGISRVYVGSDDPNSLVAGKGMQFLKDHGIDVVPHVLKEECDALNEIFFHYITKKTPYVALKYAMTMDGKIATKIKESKWITNEASRKKVQELRNQYTGIMVGIGTVLADNPMLNCRLENGRNPVRIICDTNLRLPLDCKIVESAKDIRTIVAVSKSIMNQAREGSGQVKMPDKLVMLQNLGVETLGVDTVDNKICLPDLMILLGNMGIDSVLMEGGGTLNESALSQGIVNKVYVYVAPKIFGGRDALTPVEGTGVDYPFQASHFMLHDMEKIENDVLLTYVKSNSE